MATEVIDYKVIATIHKKLKEEEVSGKKDREGNMNGKTSAK